MQRIQKMVLTEVVDFVIVHSVVGDDRQIENREWYGLAFCQSGQITYEHKGKRTISTPDTAIFLPMGETYNLYRNETGDFPLINFYCTPAFDLHDILSIPLQNPESYLRDFTLMREQFFFPYNRHKVFSLFYGMLHRLTNELSPETGRQLGGIRLVLAYIEKHYTDWDISNDVLAEVAGVSEIYMRQLFRQQMGTTPKQYILALRMDKAKQLLSEGSLTVGEIGDICGFGSVGNFGACFRKCMGMTPREYRERNRVVL